MEINRDETTTILMYFDSFGDYRIGLFVMNKNAINKRDVWSVSFLWEFKDVLRTKILV